MLLMSFSGNGVSDVMRDIQADPAVTAIDDARFWQVHYGLCMANLKLRVTGTEESLVKLREKITSLIRNRLGGGYGSGGQKWEVTLQFAAERL
jgi:Co/Zn/Cd efflux system component